MKPSDDPSSPYYRDPNAIESFPVKSYRCMEIVIEVCQEHGLSGELRRPEINDGFTVFHVKTTRSQFRAAQLEWLRRMAATLPKIPTTEPEPELC